MKNSKRIIYAAAGVITMLLAGMVYSWSVISKSIGMSYPEWTAAELSLTFTLVMICFCLGCLVAGILSGKVSAKIYVLTRAALFPAGFLIASAAHTPRMLYLGFGILCGLGTGFVYNAVMSTISAWFPDMQGLISGVLLMGFGLSSFIFGKVFAVAAPADGSDLWRTVFRIFAFLFCIVLAICSFFFVRPPEKFICSAAAGRKQVREPACERIPAHTLKTPAFWLIYIWSIMASGAGLILVSQASGIAGQAQPGIAGGTIATVVGLISIFNGCGRVFFGSLFDKYGYRLTMLLDMVFFAASGVILTGALTGGSFILLSAGFILGGFAYGGVPSVNSAISSDFFGRKNYSMNFSLLNSSLIISSFASTVAGRLYDLSGSYMNTLLLMIAVTIIGTVVFLGIRRPGRQQDPSGSGDSFRFHVSQ